MKAYGDSIVGNVRRNNEDCILIHDECEPCFVMVADGMGGAAAGEVASILTARYIEEYILESKHEEVSPELLDEAIMYANKLLLEQVCGHKELKGMGSTLTFAAVKKEKILLAQIGDSAAYLYSGGGLKKLTVDHSYVQRLVDSGKMTAKEAKKSPYRNIITRAMGMDDVEADHYEVCWNEGDILLLCSDGLTDNADISVIEGIISKDDTVRNKVDALIAYALECGGTDNISVVIVENSDREEVSC